MLIEIEKRKSDHIDLCLHENVKGKQVTNGFDQFYFRHQALPEVDFDDLSLAASFLGKSLQAPFLISSMTGGTERAWKINRHLAEAAEQKGWAMGVGSTRAALENPQTAYSFQVRQEAPSIPLIANLGAVQLNLGYGIKECRQIVEMIEADALVLHLNSIQEIIQSGGNTNFKGLYKRIEGICRELEVPVGVKEVGWGINGELAKSLFDIGVSFVDVAGAGGTSWSEVEKLRSQEPMVKKAAEAFADWGIPTAECIVEARQLECKGTLIASGGMETGVDAAKALTLGADLVGFGRSLLTDADHSTEALIQTFERIEWELKATMFAVGAESVQSLKQSPHLRKRKL